MAIDITSTTTSTTTTTTTTESTYHTMDPNKRKANRKKDDDDDYFIAQFMMTNTMMMMAAATYQQEKKPKIDHRTLPREGGRREFKHEEVLCCIKRDYLGDQALFGSQFNFFNKLSKTRFELLMQD